MEEGTRSMGKRQPFVWQCVCEQFNHADIRTCHGVTNCGCGSQWDGRAELGKDHVLAPIRKLSADAHS